MILPFPKMPRTEEPRRFEPVDPMVVSDPLIVRVIKVAAHVVATVLLCAAVCGLWVVLP